MLEISSAAEGVLAWLFTYLVHSTLILGGTALFCKRAALSVALRDLLWKAALVGGAFTATVQAAFGVSPLAGVWSLNAVPGWLAPAGDVVAAAPGAGAASLVAPVIVGCWLAFAAANLLRLVRRHLHFRALLDRRAMSDPALLAEAREIRSALAPSFPVRFSVSARYPSPLALGRGEVCLPEWFAALGVLERRSILAHELAHLARRDPLWQTAALVVSRVLFFQPLNELARRRMAEVAEHACDDWAVRSTGTALGMLRSLAAVAERFTGPGAGLVGGTAMAGGASPLLARAERLARGQCEPPRRTTAAEAALACAVMAALSLTAPACSFPGTPGAPLPRASSAEIPLSERITLVRFRPRADGAQSPERSTLGAPPVYVVRLNEVQPQPRRLAPADAREVMGLLDELRRTGSGDGQVLARIGDAVRIQSPAARR